MNWLSFGGAWVVGSFIGALMNAFCLDSPDTPKVMATVALWCSLGVPLLALGLGIRYLVMASEPHAFRKAIIVALGQPLLGYVIMVATLLILKKH